MISPIFSNLPHKITPFFKTLLVFCYYHYLLRFNIYIYREREREFELFILYSLVISQYSQKEVFWYCGFFLSGECPSCLRIYNRILAAGFLNQN